MGPSNTGKSVDRSTDWSAYAWDAQRQQWYTSRRNEQGQKERHYQDSEANTSAQQNSNVPRSFAQDSSTIDESSQSPSYATPPSGTATGISFSRVATSSFPSAPSIGSGYSWKPAYIETTPTPAYAPTNYVSSTATGVYGTNDATAYTTDFQSPTGGSAGPSSPLATFGSNSEYSSSQVNSSYQTRVQNTSSSAEYNVLSNIAEDIGGLSLNQPSTSPSQDASYPHIFGQILNPAPHSGRHEKLDDRYRVVDEKRQKSFWKVGRVFMMLWIEPARNDIAMGQSRDGSHFSRTYLNGTAFSEIRRFVVVGEGYGNTKCSPIHTYNGKATLKPNLAEPKQHAIIYTSRHSPAELSYTASDGTIVYEDLDKDPIKVKREQDDKEGDLGALSRLNYSKIYTVEHYVRILNIGMVEPESLPSLNRNSHVKPRETPIEKPRNHRSKSDHKREDRSHRGKGKGESYKKEYDKKYHR